MEHEKRYQIRSVVVKIVRNLNDVRKNIFLIIIFSRKKTGKEQHTYKPFNITYISYVIFILDRFTIRIFYIHIYDID